MLVLAGQGLAGQIVVALLDGLLGAALPLLLLAAVALQLARQGRFVGHRLGRLPGHLGNRLFHLADGLLEHPFRVLEAFGQVVQIGRDDVGNSREHSHWYSPLFCLVCLEKQCFTFSDAGQRAAGNSRRKHEHRSHAAEYAQQVHPGVQQEIQPKQNTATRPKTIPSGESTPGTTRRAPRRSPN